MNAKSSTRFLPGCPVPLAGLPAALVVICSCGRAKPAAPTPVDQQCTLGMQAEVQVPGTSGRTAANNVIVAGNLSSTNGSSTCGGSATTLSGNTNANGQYTTNAVRFNAYWDVNWAWTNTAWSNCGLSGAGPTLAPDSGAWFVDQCPE
jgi:hypothetical protein